MKKTDLLEIKKRFKYPDVFFSSMAYGVFSSDGESDDRLAFTGEGKFLIRDEDEQKAFLSILPKAFSFSATVSSEDVPVSGDLKKLFLDYSRKDEHLAFGLSEILGLFKENYSELNSYCVVIFRDNYDIPIKDESKTKTGESDEVYQYFALMICPIKATKLGLAPDAVTRDIKRSIVLKQLQAPVFGMIYPSFNERSIDEDHAFVCCKSDKERDFVNSLFNTFVEKPQKKEKSDDKAEIKPDIKTAADIAADIADLASEEPFFKEATTKILTSAIENLQGNTLEDVALAVRNVTDKLLNDNESYGAVNNIDAALLDKRGSNTDKDDEITQKIEVKKDKSEVVQTRITERDINGRHFFIVPKDILTDELLEKLLELSDG